MGNDERIASYLADLDYQRVYCQGDGYGRPPYLGECDMSDLPAVANFAPTLEVPSNAPPMKIDVNNPHLSFEDVLPANFFSMEGLQAWLDARPGAESRILTVTAVTMELLFDPSKGETAKDGEWKPVVWFAETESGLVLNKSRGQMLTKLANSPLLAGWSKVGQIAIKPGIANGKAQIIIAAVPNGEGTAGANGKPKRTVEQANEELFG